MRTLPGPTTLSSDAMIRDRLQQAILAPLGTMAEVTLADMKSVRLMNRVDTKYAARVDLLPELFRAAARAGYRVQKTGRSPLAGYRTLYYDTPACTMFVMHRNGILRRQKIRTRTYLDSGQTFLEVKNKNNRGRTEKQRIAIPAAHFADCPTAPEALPFLGRTARFDPQQLLPQLETRFDRITLVDAAMSERVTLDVDLRFDNPTSGLKAALPALAVIELKRDGSGRSTMQRLLRELGIRPFKISKYCIGTTLTRPDLSSNRFRMKLHLIEKLTAQKDDNRHV